MADSGMQHASCGREEPVVWTEESDPILDRFEDWCFEVPYKSRCLSLPFSSLYFTASRTGELDPKRLMNDTQDPTLTITISLLSPRHIASFTLHHPPT